MDLAKITQGELEQSLSLGPSLHHFAQGFLKHFGLTHLWVSQYYYDGRYKDIANDELWKKIMVAHAYYKDFVRGYLTNLTYENKDKPLVLYWEAKGENSLEKHLINHRILTGFNYFYVKEDHIENIGFASPYPLVQLLQGIGSHQKTFELFIHALRTQFVASTQSTKLTYAHQSCTFTPKHKDPFPIQALFQKEFSFFFHNHTIYLTPKELQCLLYLAHGHTQKEVAYHMKVSSKTIEFHVKHLREKCNGAPLSSIIHTFLSTPLTDLFPYHL